VAGQVIEDTYAALVGLGLNPIDARTRLDGALSSGQNYPSVEALLAAIFGKR
jgi:Holliday junction DNA helicase RuvA